MAYTESLRPWAAGVRHGVRSCGKVPLPTRALVEFPRTAPSVDDGICHLGHSEPLFVASR